MCSNAAQLICTRRRPASASQELDSTGTKDTMRKALASILVDDAEPALRLLALRLGFPQQAAQRWPSQVGEAR